jgi:hypothetical protein
VTSLHEPLGGHPKNLQLRDYLRPQRPTVGYLLQDAAAEWKRLREVRVPVRVALVFMALRVVQRLSYHRGWEEGIGGP